MAANIRDIVILKNGTSINGEVLVTTFTLQTPYGMLKLAKTDILAIQYKNPPYTLADEVQMSAGTRLEGDLSPEVIRVRIEGTTQVVPIPKKDIHSLVFFTARGKVSAATRKALKSVD
jgi:hypothetical protein